MAARRGGASFPDIAVCAGKGKLARYRRSTETNCVRSFWGWRNGVGDKLEGAKVIQEKEGGFHSGYPSFGGSDDVPEKADGE